MLQPLFPVTQQFQAKNGSNLVGGKIYTYFQGRTALATTYHDEEGTVVNSNPVLLDNNGRATVFADSAYAYTIVVCDYYGKELFSQDITLHDVTGTADEIAIIGSDNSILINRTTAENVKTFDLYANTDIIATKQSVDDLTNRVSDIESTLSDKKDKQVAKSFTGAVNKTVTSITQNANGEITVEFDTIDTKQWTTLAVTPYDSSIELTIINAAYKDGLLYFNGTVKKSSGQFNVNAVNNLFYIENIELSIDFRNYYGSAALDSSTSLFPCAMGALAGSNLFYIYPTQASNVFYFNGTAPIEMTA